MILNASKMSTGLVCWRKTFNSFIRGYKGEPSFGLADGSATHRGLAVGMATRNWDLAFVEAEKTFRAELAKKELLPGEEMLEEDHWEVTKRMIQAYREGYEQEQYQVLQPECKFAVNLPNTEHPDPFIHWLELDKETGLWSEKWNHYRFVDPQAEIEPDCVGENGRRTHFYYQGEKLEFKNDRVSPEAVLQRAVMSPHPSSMSQYLSGGPIYPDSLPNCICCQPHTVRGITDALVLWRGFPWIHEHKTSSFTGQTFWDEFLLDIQPTIYMYGVWKSTGLRPRGFIINALFKPSERQLAQWNKSRRGGPPKDMWEYISYERQAFQRTEEDLTRIESQLIDHCDEWVSRLLSGKWPLSNTKGICTQYNRLCDYHGLCTSHDMPEELETWEQKRLVQIEQRREARKAQ